MNAKRQEVEERLQIEKAVKVAEELEKEQKLLKKKQLKEVVEIDRKAKHDHSLRNQAGPVESEDNIISKFFTRKQHEAYARRAKQDIV